MQHIFNVTHPSNVLLSITTGTIGAIGIPGNVVLIILILSEYRKRKPHEWLLFILALGDLLLCMNNAFLEAPFLLNFTRVECKVSGAIDYFLGLLSFYIPPLIAYNRYLSLYDNQKCLRVFTMKRVLVYWALIWAVAGAAVSVFVAKNAMGQDDMGVCGLQVSDAILSADMAFAAGMNIVCYWVLTYFSYKVIVRIRKHKRETQSQIQSRLIKESQEIITTILIVSVIPLFAQVPAVSVKIIQIFVEPFHPWVTRTLMSTFPLTAAANAPVTMYVVKDYRRKIIGLFKKVNSRVGPQTSQAQPIPLNGPSILALDQDRPTGSGIGVTGVTGVAGGSNGGQHRAISIHHQWRQSLADLHGYNK